MELTNQQKKAMVREWKDAEEARAEFRYELERQRRKAVYRKALPRKFSRLWENDRELLFAIYHAILCDDSGECMETMALAALILLEVRTHSLTVEDLVRRVDARWGR